MSGIAAPTAAAAAETPDQALARAQAAAQARRFGEATGICNDVLAASPDHPPALALLGIIAGIARIRSAHQLLERAERPAGRCQLVCASQRALPDVYRLDEALRAGQEAIRLDPQNPDHLVDLSLAFTDVDDRERHRLPAAGRRPEARPCRRSPGAGQNLLAMGDFAPAGSNTSGGT